MYNDTDIIEGYKNTEVGIIPNDWNVLNLGDTSTLKARIGWQGLTTAEYKDSGDYILITGTDFKDGFISWDTCHYVEYERFRQDKNIQIKEGDVLVTKDGTIGKVALVKDKPMDGTLNSGVFVIRPVQNSYSQYYFYYILLSRYFESFLFRLTAGSTISHLYQKDFVHFNFPCPQSTDEQNKIVKTLMNTDEYINSLNSLINKKELIKKGAMQNLLTGKKRLPGFKGKWEDVIISDLFNVTRGYVLAVSDMKKNKCNTYKYPVYSSQTKNKGITGYYNEYLYNNAITWTTDGANAGDVNYREGKFYCTNVCGVLLSDKGYANLCVAKILGMVSKKYVSFVGNPKLMNNVVAGIKINIPSDINEQKAISKIIIDMDSEIDLLKKKKEKYIKIKEGMMQELLTGRIRLV